MKLTVLFFGRFCDLGTAISEIPEGIADTDSLSDWLSQTRPGFDDQLSSAGAHIAVNQTIITENTPICAGAEVAYMSAMSGG